MKIYQLTQLGIRLARNTNTTETDNWKVIHYLDGVGYSTPDQIASYTGLDENQVRLSLALLKRPRTKDGQTIVEER